MILTSLRALPDFSRYARKPNDQVLGQAFVIPVRPLPLPFPPSWRIHS